MVNFFPCSFVFAYTICAPICGCGGQPPWTRNAQFSFADHVLVYLSHVTKVFQEFNLVSLSRCVFSDVSPFFFYFFSPFIFRATLFIYKQITSFIRRKKGRMRRPSISTMSIGLEFRSFDSRPARKCQVRRAKSCFFPNKTWNCISGLLFVTRFDRDTLAAQIFVFCEVPRFELLHVAGK